MITNRIADHFYFYQFISMSISAPVLASNVKYFHTNTHWYLLPQRTEARANICRLAWSTMISHDSRAVKGSDSGSEHSPSRRGRSYSSRLDQNSPYLLRPSIRATQRSSKAGLCCMCKALVTWSHSQSQHKPLAIGLP